MSNFFYAFFYTATYAASADEQESRVIGNVALVSPLQPTFCIVLKLFEVAE